MPQHHPLLALCAACLTLGVASAQNRTAHPIDNPAGGTSQNIPIAGNSASWDEARSQYLFLAPFLVSTGGLITALELVPNANGSTPYERFEIWLDHTPNSTLSTTFANNLSAAPTLVYTASQGSIQWTGGTWTPLTFSQPFVYNGVDNVVMEIRKVINRPTNPPTTTISHRILTWPRRADLPVPIWAYGAYGSGAVDATTATTTYNTQILMRLQWLASPTLTIDSTRDTTGNTNRGYFHIGATWTATTRGQPNDFYVAAADFGLNPVGFPVPPLAGALWLASPVIYNSTFLDATGLGVQQFTIPQDPGFVGIRVYLQNAILTGAPQLTNVVDAPIAAY